MQNTQEYKTLVALPGQVLLNLFKHIHGSKQPPKNANGEVSRSATVGVLAPKYIGGSRDLNADLSAIGYAAPAPSVSQSEVDAAKALAQRAIDSGINLSGQLAQTNASLNNVLPLISKVHSIQVDIKDLKTDSNSMMRDISTVCSDMATLRLDVSSSMDTLRRIMVEDIAKVSELRIDPADVNAAVISAVAQEFGKFKAAVDSIPGAADVISDLVEGAENITVSDSKKLFSITAKDVAGNLITFRSVGNPIAPAIDQRFVWTTDILKVLHMADRDDGQSTLSNIWAGGEKGTGKTETARQFAARTGRPYFRINFQKFTMLEDVCGATGLKDGNTEFVPGVLLKAWATPYAVINLDELTLADPGVLGFMNGLLEPGSVISYGGKTWKRAPGVIVICSDNTFGSGDITGRYAGTRSQSAATVDRFGLMVHFDYLSIAKECDAVCNHTGCKPELAEHILKAVHAARAKVSTGEIIDAPSIRSVISFVHALKVLPVDDAWNMTIAARQPAESAVALKGIFETYIDAAFIVSNR